MRLPFMTTCRVPDSLEAVTSVRRGREARPRDLGVSKEAVRRIWSAVENWYASGIHPAIQICVRHRDEILLDRAIGHVSGNGPDDPPGTPAVLATPDTPFTIFSASKAVTAMVIHLLDQQNLLRLDDPVCEYIPEFGVHHKQWITIRHILSHRAGIPNIPPEAMDLDLLGHPDRIVQLLSEGEQTWRPGRYLAYHAVSGGFILAEVVRRITGKSIRAVMDREIRKPLGMRWMNYGVRTADIPRVARNYFTGPPALPPFSTALRRALGVDFRQATEMSNDPRFLRGIIPSANLVCTANELSALYQLMLNGGELNGVRIFETRTIRRATAEQSYLEFDLTLGVPVRYAMGFMLGGEWFSLYGFDTPYAFGHLGFTNIISWADPQRLLAAAILTSGKPLVYPQLYYAFDVVRQIGNACSKQALQPCDFYKPAKQPARLRAVKPARPAVARRQAG